MNSNKKHYLFLWSDELNFNQFMQFDVYLMLIGFNLNVVLCIHRYCLRVRWRGILRMMWISYLRGLGRRCGGCVCRCLCLCGVAIFISFFSCFLNVGCCLLFRGVLCSCLRKHSVEIFIRLTISHMILMIFSKSQANSQFLEHVRINSDIDFSYTGWKQHLCKYSAKMCLQLSNMIVFSWWVS